MCVSWEINEHKVKLGVYKYILLENIFLYNIFME